MKKQTKITFILLGLAVLSAILHNAVFAIFEIEEPVFFILTLLFALAFVVSVFWNLILILRDMLGKKKPKD